MAPRRGGGSSGGSGGGGFESSCPGAFSGYGLYSSSNIAYFVSYCIFFVLTFGILIAHFRIRKRHANAKKLAGPLYLLSLLFTLLGYALLIIATMLRECQTLDDPFEYYNFSIAFGIFFKIANFLLLVVVVWGINSLLRQRLGSGQAFSKIVCMAVLGFMAALTCAYIGLSAYNTWTITPAGFYVDSLSDEVIKLAVAYYVLYLVSVLAGGVLAAMAIKSMRSKQLPANGLFGTVLTTFFCMFLWVLISVVQWIYFLPEHEGLDLKADQALTYLIDFFQTFAYIAVLVVAKSHVWDSDAAATTTYDPNGYSSAPIYVAPPSGPQYGHAAPMQAANAHAAPPQQYAYNGQPPQQHPPQQYYYNQQSVAGHKA